MSRRARAERRQAVSTKEIQQAMAARWKAPEHALLWEVGDATGSGQSRWADAVIMSLWPSRGLELHGVEIKVSRNDWLRELARPEKAEQVARYVDRWWIHAAPGVVREGELPKTWGLREYDGDWSTVVDAPELKPEPPSREFLAALLRRADRAVAQEAARLAAAEIEEARSAVEERIEHEVQRRTGQEAAAFALVEALERETGLGLEALRGRADAAKAARMVAAVIRSGLADDYMGLDGVLHTLREMTRRTETAMAEFGITPTAPAAAPRKR